MCSFCLPLLPPLLVVGVYAGLVGERGVHPPGGCHRRGEFLVFHAEPPPPPQKQIYTKYISILEYINLYYDTSMHVLWTVIMPLLPPNCDGYAGVLTKGQGGYEYSTMCSKTAIAVYDCSIPASPKTPADSVYLYLSC